MSQRDVLAELSTARVEAPPELRARVRLVAAQAAPARRRPRWRLALVVAPVAAAATIAAVVVATRPSHRGTAVQHGETLQTFARRAPKAAGIAPAPAPARRRAQRYSASLSLRVADTASISNAVQRALRIAGSLGGYPVSVHVESAGRKGDAQVVLRVPRKNVQQAVAQLAQLGAVVGERLDIQDLQAGVNATDRTIQRLQRRLAQLRAQPRTPATQREIAQLTARVVALQRARASTLRAAHYATVQLALRTPPRPRASHGGVGVRDVLPWLGGAAAALLVLLALRLLRRWRVDALLNRT